MSKPSESLLTAITHRIADPGAYTKRGDDYREPISSWSARAVAILFEERFAAVRAQNERFYEENQKLKAEKAKESGGDKESLELRTKLLMSLAIEQIKHANAAIERGDYKSAERNGDEAAGYCREFSREMREVWDTSLTQKEVE